MIVSLIAAVTENHGLGKNGDLLHKCPVDMHHFKYTTEGSILIMGRKTYESIPGGFLPNREIVVIGSGAGMFPSVAAAIDHIEQTNPDARVFIAGGAKVYKEALDLGIVGLVYLTTFYFQDENTDTWFPYPELSNSKRSINMRTYRTSVAEGITVKATIKLIILDWM